MARSKRGGHPARSPGAPRTQPSFPEELVEQAHLFAHIANEIDYALHRNDMSLRDTCGPASAATMLALEMVGAKASLAECVLTVDPDDRSMNPGWAVHRVVVADPGMMIDPTFGRQLCVMFTEKERRRLRFPEDKNTVTLVRSRETGSEPFQARWGRAIARWEQLHDVGVPVDIEKVDVAQVRALVDHALKNFSGAHASV